MSAVGHSETKTGRAKTVHPLGLKETSCLPYQTKLPTTREVFCTFLYRHVTLGESVYDAASAVTKEIREIYELARLPLQDNTDIIRKIQTIHKNYRKIKKSQSRKTETQRNKEQEFLAGFEKLFVVVKLDWKNADPTPLPEDVVFYEKQLLPGRPGYMAGFDVDFAAQQDRAVARKRAADNFREKNYSSASASVVPSATLDEQSDAEGGRDVAEEEFQGPTPKIPKKKILTPVLSSTLDWAKLSSRKATGVVAATLASLGENAADYRLNRESLRVQRNSNREWVAKNLKESLQQDDAILSLHWDGVMVPDNDSNQKVNRLPVHVVGIDERGEEQLLGVPKVQRGDAKSESGGIHQVLVNWNVVKRIRRFCFDTTNVNSGRRNGNCVRLEQLLDEDIFHLACRHHICELVLKCVFEISLGSTTSPTLELCQDFKRKWKELDLSKVNPGSEDRAVMTVIRDDMDGIIMFCKQQLKEFHPREDYRELLRVTLVFLGEELPDGKTLREPGATHDARWMVKAQYAILMYLYRRQFKLEDVRHEEKLKKLCIFIVKFYIKQWFLSRIASLAPLNDLQFLQTLALTQHAAIKPLCDAAIRKFQGHLWYLSEDLVGLALFDARVPDEEKRKIVEAMEKSIPISEDPPKRVSVDPKTIVEKSLSSFTTQNSRRIFQRLNLPDGFMQSDPSEWDSSAEFQKARKIISNLQVVNDVAERGVALLKEFNEIITKDEEQKQFLLLAVQHHRKTYPNVNKETLAKMTNNSTVV